MCKIICNVLFGGQKEGSLIGEIGLLILRAFAGLSLALAHGWGKLPPPDQLLAAVTKMGFPIPGVFAWVSVLAEFAGGLLLALGLLTRPAAFFVAFNMFVAAFIALDHQPFGVRELALFYLVIALAFLFRGAGPLGVDRLLRR